MEAFDTQLIIFSIGWSLIHFLWQGTLITLTYWIITRSIQSIHAKYWVGMGLVVLSLATLLVNINPTAATNFSDGLLVPFSNTVISHQQLDLQGLLLYLINVGLPYIVLIWAVTVAILSVRLIRSWMQLAAIKHDCEPAISNQLKQYVKNIAIKLDLPTVPFLKVSKKVTIPAAYGLIKPTILLPLSLLSQIPRNQLEAIIKHELCHLKRNDFIHNIIQLFADIILFFHPGIRWMNNDIRHIREQCCDQMVLSQDTEPLTYAKALTNIAAYTNNKNSNPKVYLAINDGVLLNRVKFLLQDKSSQSSAILLLPFLLIIFTVLFLLSDMNATEGVSKSMVYQQSLSNDDPANNQQRKFMKNQMFYPQFKNTDNTTNINEIGTSHLITNQLRDTLNNSNFIATKQPEISNQGISKEQLQIELLKEMQLRKYATDILPNNINAFNPQIQQPPSNQLLQQTENTLPVSTLDTVNINNSPVITANINLISIDKSDSILPEFENYYAPRYPQKYSSKQIEQDVLATFRIDSNGRVYEMVLSSKDNDYKAFEQKVEKAMKLWRFNTNSLNNNMLQRTYQQIFSFKISNEMMQNCEITPTGTRISRSVPCNKL